MDPVNFRAMLIVTQDSTPKRHSSHLLDNSDGALLSAIRYARTIGDVSLINCLKHLNVVHHAGYALEGGYTKIYADRAPLSFYFERFTKDGNFRGNGGVIFHGAHDGFGSGSAPTFSVTIKPTSGWAVQT